MFMELFSILSITISDNAKSQRIGAENVKWYSQENLDERNFELLGRDGFPSTISCLLTHYLNTWFFSASLNLLTDIFLVSLDF
jgi:hypothetical protein